MSVEMPAFEHDYYEILQVHPKATLAVIKKAYRTLLLEMGHHPDQGGSTEAAARITEAYKVLADPDRRSEYDRYYMARMGLGPQPHAPSKAARPKEPVQETPKAASEAGASSLVVLCPRCRTKNRVRSQELLALAKCSRCGQHLNKLPNPLASLWDQGLGRVGDRLGRSGMPPWVKLAIPLAMIASSLAGIAYTFQDLLIPIGDPIEQADQLHGARQFDQAAALLKRAIEREPGNPRLLEKLGDVYTKQALHDQALMQYAAAIRLNPSNSYLYTLQGNSFKRLGRTVEAALSYKSALKLDPQQVPALAALGDVYAREQRYQDAADLYRQALRLEKSADVLYNLGLVYEWDGKAKDAQEAFQRALIEDPRHRPSMMSLAALYYEQQQYDLAAEQLVRASALKHADPELHQRLAEIYERTGRKAEAIREWQVSLAQANGQAIGERARGALKRLGVTAR